MTDPALVRAAIDRAASDEVLPGEAVLPLVYDELRALAQSRLSRLPPGGTLEATALVHEAYLRIAPRQPGGWHGRRHFFFAAARAIRDILVEQARRKASRKHGGEFQRVGLTLANLEAATTPEQLVSLDEDLRALEQESPDAYQVVLLRFFGGLELEEIAATVDVSLSTVNRRWRFARAWLLKALDAERLGRGDA
ncbi:MAG: ECF-type sigma factor [Planctomycetota bacterium]